jgi:hypothetical protein
LVKPQYNKHLNNKGHDMKDLQHFMDLWVREALKNKQQNG